MNMNKKITILLFVNMLIGGICYAQKSDKFSLNIGFGANATSSELTNKWPVRQNVGSVYTMNGYYGSLNLSGQISYLEVRPEYFFEKNLSVSAGLKFVDVYSMTTRSDEDGFFYLRYNSSGTSTEYARVYSIDESVAYITIPVEVKLIPFVFDDFSFYAKVGAEIGVKVYTDRNILFKSSAMQAMEQEILDGLDLHVNSTYSSVYSAIGMQYKFLNNMSLKFDVFLPAFYMTEDNSSMFDIKNFGGTAISLAIPLAKTVK